MNNQGVGVIATTLSGSIADWRKVERILPLFREHGREDVTLHVVGTHAEARRQARVLVQAGVRTIISAGGSGTFNSVLEGCLDAGGDPGATTLGFLRKGSADLIGKTLGMPDSIEKAIEVFANSMAAGRTVRCDVIEVLNDMPDSVPRHFVGYGGAELFGRIPHYTENRFVKYYKGILSQLFGDLGPFSVGTTLAAVESVFVRMLGRKRRWRICVDGREAVPEFYQAIIIVNGYLGPDLPYAREVPLGSGDFYVFALRDQGLLRFPLQIHRAWNASIMDDPDRWGFERFRVEKTLRLEPEGDGPFPVNVDGATLICQRAAKFRIAGQVSVLSA